MYALLPFLILRLGVANFFVSLHFSYLVYWRDKFAEVTFLGSCNNRPRDLSFVFRRNLDKHRAL